jgi:hypothetical protein
MGTTLATTLPDETKLLALGSASVMSRAFRSGSPTQGVADSAYHALPIQVGATWTR